MNLLIVDDEMYIVRAITGSIDWASIGIDQVFTAFNVPKAREVFQNEQVDILLTDVEMPGENGMDLVRWVLATGHDPVRLCLTCHAEFEYAQEAIGLGFADYYVKPIDFKELGDRLGEIVMQVRHRNSQDSQQRLGKYWEDNRQVVQSSFWSDLLTGRIGHTPQVIAEEAKQRHADYRFDAEYIPVMVCARYHGLLFQEWDKEYELLEYALRNIAEEMLENLPPQQVVTCPAGLVFICERSEGAALQESVDEYIETCRSVLGIGLVVYSGQPVYGEELPAEYKRLQRLDEENVVLNEGRYIDNLANCTQTPLAVRPPLPRELTVLLQAGRYGDFSAAANQMLRTAATAGKKELQYFLFDMAQVLGEVLSERGLWLHQLLTQDSRNLMVQAAQSQQAAELWLRETMNKLATLEQENRNEYILVQKVQEYIHQNLGTKLPRQELADHVHLSADYLTKLFKRVTGVALVQYIIDTRMEQAARMIAEGGQSIGDVAGQLGYDNFSYFSNLFKRSTGVTPSEYKREYQNSALQATPKTE